MRRFCGSRIDEQNSRYMEVKGKGVFTSNTPLPFHRMGAYRLLIKKQFDISAFQNGNNPKNCGLQNEEN